MILNFINLLSLDVFTHDNPDHVFFVSLFITRSQGAGYIEFSTTEEADAAMKLDGKELLGRYVHALLEVLYSTFVDTMIDDAVCRVSLTPLDMAMSSE